MKKWGTVLHVLHFFLVSVADTQILSSLLLTSIESKVFFPLKSTWPESYHTLIFLADSKLLVLENSQSVLWDQKIKHCVEIHFTAVGPARKVATYGNHLAFSLQRGPQG